MEKNIIGYGWTMFLLGVITGMCLGFTIVMIVYW